jgi:ElaB/YqjD/DUF883 family membrane-anchored ribosome-binding protein
MAEHRSRPGREPFATTEEAADLGARASDTVREYREQALERTADAARAARDTVAEHPLATLAIVAGLGFAIGALWKMSGSRRESVYDGLLARLSDLQRQAARHWQ